MPNATNSSDKVAASSSKDIADRGVAIYDRLYRADFERKWSGRYAAVDIISEQAVVEDFPETALAKARSTFPEGVFYLVRIGSRGAFRISRRALNADPRNL
jgi:hypothetical protein